MTPLMEVANRFWTTIRVEAIATARRRQEDAWENWVPFNDEFTFEGDVYQLNCCDFISSHRKKNPVVIKITEIVMGEVIT